MTAERVGRRPEQGTPATDTATIKHNSTGLHRQLRQTVERIDYAELLRRRAVQQAILDVQAWQWRRRADAFEHARPRIGDFTGRASAQQLAAADARCAATARACRAYADAIEDGWVTPDLHIDIDDLIGGSA